MFQLRDNYGSDTGGGSENGEKPEKYLGGRSSRSECQK